jgi:hypothetical protein
MGRVVLDRPAQYAAQRAAQSRVQAEPDVLMVTGSDATAGCARLTLDRGGGHTLLAPCDPGADQSGLTSGETLPRSDLTNAAIPPDTSAPVPLSERAAGLGSDDN